VDAVGRLGQEALMEFVGFDEVTRFTRPGDEAVMIEAGLYRVEAAGDGQLALIGEDGTATLVEAEPGGHPLELEAPLAVAFDFEKGDRRLAVLLPGGLALVAGGPHTGPADRRGQKIFGCPGFAGAVLMKSPLEVVLRREYLSPFHKFGFGTIEPGTSPTPFAPQTFPPNWVRTTVVTCHVPPKGSYGPGGPGTASGVPPFPPGSEVRRGPYPGYLVSTTPVRATYPGSVAGKPIELHVTAHVTTIGIPTILAMTWKDVYRIVPTVDGPVDFPAVIVATGRVPPGPPPAGVSYTAQVQAQLTSSTGFGVPILFDLYVHGIWLASRQMAYYASYPGGPPPVIADK
jgi:hypothetical protein